MPEPPLYPGVYVEEVPTGVQAIAGVSTSDTAFVDYFPRGPIRRATRITSWAAFEHEFGGLDRTSEASYAIQQYFLNGGRVAWVVRVAATDAKIATRSLTSAQALPGTSGAETSGTAGAPGVVLQVASISPGAWGNNLQVAVDCKGVTTDESGSAVAFNLVVREIDESGGKLRVRATETFRNVNVDSTSSRYVDAVVNRDSSLVQVTYLGGAALPAQTGDDIVGDPGHAQWLCLGQDGYQDGETVEPAVSAWGTVPHTTGENGTTPDTENWRSSEGAAALLGTQVEGAPEPFNAGIYELERIAPSIFNLLCIPCAAGLAPTGAKRVLAATAALCEKSRAFLLIDIPEDVNSIAKVTHWITSEVRPNTSHAAVYFPRPNIPDALNGNAPRSVGPSGTLAGVFARTDADRGVWKAPAGVEATLRNVSLPTKLTDIEASALNLIGVNTLRSVFNFGNVAWGGRTLEGSVQAGSEWKYIPVRRTASFIEESLYQGLQWVVFEPNDEPLWAQIRLNVGAFLNSLFRQGALQGTTPREAYFVRCDKDTTTQDDINKGIVNILVGFAPLKPAEFVIVTIAQVAGQTA